MLIQNQMSELRRGLRMERRAGSDCRRAALRQMRQRAMDDGADDGIRVHPMSLRGNLRQRGADHLPPLPPRSFKTKEKHNGGGDVGLKVGCAYLASPSLLRAARRRLSGPCHVRVCAHQGDRRDV